jgi:hypothetical protein
MKKKRNPKAEKREILGEMRVTGTPTRHFRSLSPNPANIALPCIEPRILISQFLLDTPFGFVALNAIWPGLRFPSRGLATRLLELASFQSAFGISPLAMYFYPIITRFVG